jgi:hypothetical protein
MHAAPCDMRRMIEDSILSHLRTIVMLASRLRMVNSIREVHYVVSTAQLSRSVPKWLERQKALAQSARHPHCRCVLLLLLEICDRSTVLKHH